jgi:hypothetical protein
MLSAKILTRIKDYVKAEDACDEIINYVKNQEET